MEHIWAGWRSGYVGGLVRAELAVEDPDGRSIFERLIASDLPDDETFVVRRGRRCAVLLNIHPYNPGHLMVLPNRAVPELTDLDDDEHAELWDLVRAGVVAVQRAFHPDGVNVGANLGGAAGAGVPGHLHVHVLPRWSADTNFMTAVANTRVLPVPLDETWRRLRDAWPDG